MMHPCVARELINAIKCLLKNKIVKRIKRVQIILKTSNQFACAHWRLALKILILDWRLPIRQSLHQSVQLRLQHEDPMQGMEVLQEYEYTKKIAIFLHSSF